MRTDSERIAVIEVTVLDLKKELFGNGQPGELEIIRRRVIALEKWRWWVGGAAVGAGTFLGYILR